MSIKKFLSSLEKRAYLHSTDDFVAEMITTMQKRPGDVFAVMNSFLKEMELSLEQETKDTIQKQPYYAFYQQACDDIGHLASWSAKIESILEAYVDDDNFKSFLEGFILLFKRHFTTIANLIQMSEPDREKQIRYYKECADRFQRYSSSIKPFTKIAQESWEFEVSEEPEVVIRDKNGLRIGIDIDGVLADTHSVLMDLASEHVPIDDEDRQKYGVQETKHGSDGLRNQVFEEIFEKGLIAEAPMIPGAADKVNELYDAGNEIYIITARKKNWEEQTKEWLKNNGIKYHKLIMGAGKKGDVAKEEGIDVFIEDSSDNIENLEGNGIRAFVFSQPWNQDSHAERIEQWKNVKACTTSAPFGYGQNSMDSIKSFTKIAGLEEKIPVLSKKYNISEEEVRSFANYDPTNNKAYLEWIIRHRQELRDIQHTQDVLKVFERSKRALEKKDINQYKTFLDLENALAQMSAEDIESKRGKQKQSQEQGQKVLYNKAPYRVIEVNTSEAGAFLFRKTSWCVKDPKFFEEYKPPFYMIEKNGSPYVLFHADSEQFKDIEDQEVDENVKEEILPLLQAALKLPHPAALTPLTAIEYAMKVGHRVPELEDVILRGHGNTVEAGVEDMEYVHPAIKYAANIIGGRWPQLEERLLKNLDKSGGMEEAVRYAVAFHTRFPEIEKVLLNPAKYDVEQGYESWLLPFYAEIIGERWPEAEEILFSTKYINKLREEAKMLSEEEREKREMRGIGLEDRLGNIVDEGIEYASSVGQRVPKVEEMLLGMGSELREGKEYQIAELAAKYVKKVMKSSWPEMEEKLYRTPRAALKYAAELGVVLPKEVEDNILKNFPGKDDWLQNFLIWYAIEGKKQRIPKLEENIIVSRESLAPSTQLVKDYDDAFGTDLLKGHTVPIYQFQEPAQANIKSFTKRAKQSPTLEMEDFFKERTAKHIDLVNKYLEKLKEHYDYEFKDAHDNSKYADPEHEPYLYITWKHKMRDEDEDYEIPEEWKDKCDEATFHHIKNNRHHPEYWDDTLTENPINKENRDEPSGKIVDATKMPDEHVLAMVADWCAMSEEKENTPKEWADKNIGIRWEFSPEQKELIYEAIDMIWGDKKEASIKSFTKLGSPRWTPEDKVRLKELYIKYRQRGIPHHIIYKAAAILLDKTWLAVKQKLESMYGLEDELKGMKFEHWDKEKIDKTIQDLYSTGKPINRINLPANLMYQITNHSAPKSISRDFETFYDSFDHAMASNILVIGFEREGDKLTEKPIKTLEDALKFYRRKEKLCHTWTKDEIVELLQEAHVVGLPLTYSFFRSHPDIYKPLMGVSRSLEGLRDSIKRNGYTWCNLVVEAVPEYADFYSEDGRMKSSTEEMRVRRFLELNNIPFKTAGDVEKIAVNDPELNEMGYKHFLPDFVVLDKSGNVSAYVEVFGSIADSGASNTAELYREKKKAKEKFYSTLPYRFIAVNNNTDGIDLTDEILKQKFGSFLGM